jgi:uncharacterized protein YeaO (DUF488 family)
MVRLKRVYDPPDDEDGERFLVERLWPRGMGRSEARLTGWVKELAPSPALRKWFSHDPERWAEFQRRYRAELRAPEKRLLLAELAAKAARGDITLVFAARDKERNSAVVLKRVLENRGSSENLVSPARRL